MLTTKHHIVETKYYILKLKSADTKAKNGTTTGKHKKVKHKTRHYHKKIRWTTVASPPPNFLLIPMSRHLLIIQPPSHTVTPSFLVP